MTTTLSLTESFEQWLEDHRDSAGSAWEQVMHNIIAAAQCEIAELDPDDIRHLPN